MKHFSTSYHAPRTFVSSCPSSVLPHDTHTHTHTHNSCSYSSLSTSCQALLCSQWTSTLRHVSYGPVCDSRLFLTATRTTRRHSQNSDQARQSHNKHLMIHREGRVSLITTVSGSLHRLSNLLCPSCYRNRHSNTHTHIHTHSPPPLGGQSSFPCSEVLKLVFASSLAVCTSPCLCPFTRVPYLATCYWQLTPFTFVQSALCELLSIVPTSLR